MELYRSSSRPVLLHWARPALSLRQIEKPRPHAIMRNHATGLRRRIGLGNSPPQGFEFGVLQIRVHFGRLSHAGILGGSEAEARGLWTRRRPAFREQPRLDLRHLHKRAYRLP